MITCLVEKFDFDELKPLLHDHYKELALNQDKVPLSPQWHVYQEREARGETIYVAMREAGKLVGYFVGFIAPGLHYSTCLTCTMDIFWIHPDKRGGRLGIRLFKFVEEQLKNRGVDRWFVGSKCHKEASWLFEYLRFEKVEVYYSKYLGE
jgi:N-acetylglutamate synthase-like GNAT family acetyltransferase